MKTYEYSGKYKKNHNDLEIKDHCHNFSAPKFTCYGVKNGDFEGGLGHDCRALTNVISRISYTHKRLGSSLFQLQHVKIQGEACDLEESPHPTTQLP